ncbi:hypothetical protein PspLS_03018 [Pyricularia sp. CBS 133598]|nr:hypothetical protein PspLS_03018 [Pyricularia sp. CBS 133598]
MHIKTVFALAFLTHGVIAAPSETPPIELNAEGIPVGLKAIKTKPSSTFDADKFSKEWKYPR